MGFRKTKPAKALNQLVEPKGYSVDVIGPMVATVAIFGWAGIGNIIDHGSFFQSALFLSAAGFMIIVPAIEIMIYKIRCHSRERAKLK